MASGITDKLWEMDNVVKMIEEREIKKIINEILASNRGLMLESDSLDINTEKPGREPRLPYIRRATNRMRTALVSDSTLNQISTGSQYGSFNFAP